MLEGSRKWAAVKAVLQGIKDEEEEDEEINNGGGGGVVGGGSSSRSGCRVILILAQDERTCWELRDYLVDGPELVGKKAFLR